MNNLATTFHHFLQSSNALFGTIVIFQYCAQAKIKRLAIEDVLVATPRGWL